MVKARSDSLAAPDGAAARCVAPEGSCGPQRALCEVGQGVGGSEVRFRQRAPGGSRAQ